MMVRIALACILTTLIIGANDFSASFAEDKPDSKTPPSQPATQDAAPEFTNLKEAVAYIAACLDNDQYDKLAAACAGNKRKPEKYVLEILKKTHQDTPLPTLYAGKEFPADKTIFKLGGHMSELGCMHVDFVKKNEKWMLSFIWICK